MTNGLWKGSFLVDLHSFTCDGKNQMLIKKIGMSRVLPAGVLGNLRKSGDVCIFGLPGVISGPKHGQNAH